MYPDGERTRVRVTGVTEHLCGASRPGHFDGVATVVTKLFAAAGPCVAVFGRKDYQQLQVIKRMTLDLLLPVEVVGFPTVREPDGLALSSRNAHLSPEERNCALALPRALAARDRSLLDRVEVDYFEEADFEPRVLAAAVRVGSTRLIDNVVLEGDPS
jgi:pantoate--beta-alanine ligase